MTTKKIDVYDHIKRCSSNVHAYHFLSIFVQAMSYSIAIALEHNVSFIKGTVPPRIDHNLQNFQKCVFN